VGFLSNPDTFLALKMSDFFSCFDNGFFYFFYYSAML